METLTKLLLKTQIASMVLLQAMKFVIMLLTLAATQKTSANPGLHHKALAMAVPVLSLLKPTCNASLTSALPYLTLNLFKLNALDLSSLLKLKLYPKEVQKSEEKLVLKAENRSLLAELFVIPKLLLQEDLTLGN
jgi:hypothetical protein